MNAHSYDRRLLAFDFDGTLANTFQQSPSGMCVELACLNALQAIFGKRGSQAFEAAGLLNRAPGELLRAIVEKLGCDYCVSAAKKYFDDNFEKLESLMPEGKGLPLEWTHSNPHDIMTELFVRAKLLHLFQEIGSSFSDGGIWPRPMEGVREFLIAVQATGKTDIAILSSGHDQFIQRCFELWGIEPPMFVISDDDLRPLTNLSIERRSKPSSYLFWMLVNEWSKRVSGSNGSYRVDRMYLREMRKHVTYFGDDPVRDGGLARHGGVPFYLYDPNKQVTNLHAGTTVFCSWHQITGHFV